MRFRNGKLYRLFLIWTACTAVLAVFTPVVATASLWELQFAYPLEGKAGLQPPGVILVAGGGLHQRQGEKEEPGRFTRERLRQALKLQQLTGLPLLLTGYEAPAMREWLLKQTGPSRLPVIWMEAESRNTCQNALYSARHLRQRRIRASYVVTDPWHMARLRHAMAENGVQTVASPTPTAPSGLLPYAWMSLRAGYELAAAVRDHWLPVDCHGSP